MPAGVGDCPTWHKRKRTPRARSAPRPILSGKDIFVIITPALDIRTKPPREAPEYCCLGCCFRFTFTYVCMHVCMYVCSMYSACMHVCTHTYACNRHLEPSPSPGAETQGFFMPTCDNSSSATTTTATSTTDVCATYHPPPVYKQHLCI